MIERLDREIAAAFNRQIAQPRLARLGNPTIETGDRINVPLTETDQPGMVYIHDLAGEAQGVGMALNAGPGRIADREKVFGAPVLVRERADGTFVIAGTGYEDYAEYVYNVPLEDPALINVNRLDYGLLQPTEPRSMQALVSKAYWREAGAIYQLPDQFTKDFTADIPAAAGQAIAVLVEVTPSTGALAYTNGSTFDAALTHEQAFAAYYPQPTGALVGWVKLTSGMTTIERDNLLPAVFVLGETSDEKAKVSANDTTAGYLNGKLVAGGGITLVENDDGANETLEIQNTGVFDVSGDLGTPFTVSDGSVMEFVGANGIEIETDIFGGVTIRSQQAYLVVRDEKTQGTDGGTFTSGAWQTRELNTEATDIGDIGSLASNQITLEKGTYVCTITCPASQVGRHQARLQNITDSETTLLGMSAKEAAGEVSVSVIQGIFTILSAKTFEVQHRCETTRATDGFGIAGNFATEIYTVAIFRRIL